MDVSATPIAEMIVQTIRFPVAMLCIAITFVLIAGALKLTGRGLFVMGTLSRWQSNKWYLQLLYLALVIVYYRDDDGHF